MRSDKPNLNLPIRDRILDLSRPRIMGILNVTPDSFSDGGLFVSVPDALEQIGRMIAEGAEIIDIGGESTRPGSDPVSLQEELDRVIPVLEKAIPEYRDTFFSIDTTKYDVARAALELGVHIVNDVSGLQKEPKLAELTAEFGAGYLLMHSQGDPKTMQRNPEYEDVAADLVSFFREKVSRLEKAGVDSILIDPGIGFGKTLAHNLYIVAKLDKFREFGYPIVIGASRKSMLGQILDDRPVEGRLAGTLAIHYHCLMNGASVLRVHDVREANDSIKVFNAVQTAKP